MSEIRGDQLKSIVVTVEVNPLNNIDLTLEGFVYISAPSTLV